MKKKREGDQGVVIQKEVNTYFLIGGQILFQK